MSNTANVSVAGSPVVDSTIHSLNIVRHEGNMETDAGLPAHNYWDSYPGS